MLGTVLYGTGDLRFDDVSNGLTQAQASEVLTHITFYVGWPNASSALPVFKDVFEKRRQH